MYSGSARALTGVLVARGPRKSLARSGSRLRNAHGDCRMGTRALDRSPPRPWRAYGPQGMLEPRTGQGPLHNSKKDGAGRRVLSAKSGNGLSTSRGEGRKASVVWGAVLRSPSSHLAPTGGWYRQVPTAPCYPAPPPPPRTGGADGGRTGGLRRPS